MKISITFSDTTPVEAARLLTFVNGNGDGIVGSVATEEPVTTETKPRKPRRTKKEMEAARAEKDAKDKGAGEGDGGQPVDVPEASDGTPDPQAGHDSAPGEERGTGGSSPRRRRGQPVTEAATTSARKPRRPRAEQIAADNAADPKAAKEAADRAAAAAAAPSGAIKDKDLTTAASHAAQAISPAGVNAVLEQFGVVQVNDLKAEVRQEFLDTLQEAVNKTKDIPL